MEGNSHCSRVVPGFRRCATVLKIAEIARWLRSMPDALSSRPTERTLMHFQTRTLAVYSSARSYVPAEKIPVRQHLRPDNIPVLSGQRKTFPRAFQE